MTLQRGHSGQREATARTPRFRTTSLTREEEEERLWVHSSWPSSREANIFIKAQYLEYYYNVPDHHLWNFLVCPWEWFGELSVLHLYFLPTGPPPWRGASLVVKWWRICLQCGRPGFYSLSQEDPLEKGMATHSSILARRIPWTEEPRGLQSMGSQSRTQMSDFHFPKGHCILFSLPFLLVSMVQKPIPLDKAPPPPGSLSQSF